MESTVFTQLSIVIAVVVVISIIMRLLKQPLIIGYIITGVLVGPSFLHIVKDIEAFSSFSTIGITLLLFIVGLGLNANVIKSLGKVAFATTLTVLPILGAIMFLFSHYLLGLSVQASIILSIALCFSSTIIILKVLTDKKEISRLYGQITLGVLLIEDVIATVAVVLLAVASNPGSMSLTDIGLILLKGIGLGMGLYVVGTKLLPHVIKWLAKSQELLFLFSIGWGLLVSTIFHYLGFSHEVGALFAGVSLAGLPYAAEMAARLKPLRDFFIVIFFVSLGEAFTVGSLAQNIIPALVLSILVIVMKPILFISSLSAQRYTKFTSFKTGIHLTQISEFSIIFVSIAHSRGLVGTEIVSLVTLVAFITIGVSSYLMKYDDDLFRWLERPMRHLERSSAHEPKRQKATYPVILFGYHKGGYEFIKTFRDMRSEYLVVDYDPDVIDHLEAQGIRHAYGDATDEEFLEDIAVNEAKLVVSTMTDVMINRLLLTYLRRHNHAASFICHADNYDDAVELYSHGASYVSLPHMVGSERISSFIKHHGMTHTALKDYRDKHLITIGRQALKG